MSVPIQVPATDMAGTVPGNYDWEPHSTHTHYVGFVVPEHAISVFAYIRYLPFFPLCQGSVCIFRGLDNLHVLDTEHMDWQTQPYPTVDGNTITTPNGLRIEFLELGQRLRATYSDPEANTSFDVEQVGLTPLVGRDAVIPGENLDRGMQPTGTEQFMHVTGELTLHGERIEVDSYTARDRSIAQSRTEQRGGRHAPPIAWTPMWFAETEFGFNQVGFEMPDSNPVWAGALEIPEGMPTHHFAWVYRDGQLLEVTENRRSVSSLTAIGCPLEQEIEASDEAGNSYHFRGEAIAASPVPSWMNAYTFDSVVRWEEENMGTAYATCQGIWYDGFQKLLRGRA